MLKRTLVMILLSSMILLRSSVGFSYTSEEQYVYDNLYLQLPWEAAKNIKLTQQNRDFPTHIVGSVDEYALDFGLASGTPVVAAESGVAYVYRDGSTNASAYGNHIKIDHGYFYTLYAHLSSIENGIDGAEVKKGDVIGLSGNTGVHIGSGGGYHLHFGLYHGYAYDDGYSYSVQSKIVSANEGSGPYQTLSSLQFENEQFYLSGNFKSGQEGVIICGSSGCYVDTSVGVGGFYTLPDFIGIKMWLVDSSGKDKTVFRAGEQIQMKAQFKNVGTDSPSDITVKFYLSNGVKVDSNKQTVGTDNIRDYNMESGETQTETESLTAPTTKGTYNIIACADTEKVVTEQHESNNCTEVAVFRVDDLRWINPIINYILD
jgi:hypothetical protein